MTLALDQFLKLRPKLRGAVIVLITERMEQINSPDVETILFGQAGVDSSWNQASASLAALRFEAWGNALGLVCRLPWLKGPRFASVADDALACFAQSVEDSDEERAIQRARWVELVRDATSAEAV